MEEKLGYLMLEVGGIQNFILATGKLKEMLGGSELIESLSKDFLRDFCEDYGYTLLYTADDDEFGIKANPKCPADGEILALQVNAGSIHLLFQDRLHARSFLKAISLRTLALYPGLPLFGAADECSFDRKSIAEAKGRLRNAIAAERSRAPASSGMSMLPVCECARLDGLPAAGFSYSPDSKEPVSLPSITRSRDELLENAENRLNIIKNGGSVRWPRDFNELSAPVNKIAFIHMDGNDLGKLFRNFFKNLNDGISIEEYLRSTGELSKVVETSSREAFAYAVEGIEKFERTRLMADDEQTVTMPLRPLVLGGDDVTVAVRADLGLLFINRFVSKFEEKARTKDGTQLSMGVGMVVASAGYPFLRAFNLSESLLDNAKNLTKDSAQGKRPSSIDWIVMTSEVESDLKEMRRHNDTALQDGALLTGKPYLLEKGSLKDFLEKGIKVLYNLPRSAVRPALNECRHSERAGNLYYEQMLKNIARGIGGRHNETTVSPAEQLKIFKDIFPDGFFERRADGISCTKLGDYIELRHLLPADRNDLKTYLELLDD